MVLSHMSRTVTLNRNWCFGSDTMERNSLISLLHDNERWPIPLPSLYFTLVKRQTPLACFTVAQLGTENHFAGKRSSQSLCCRVVIVAGAVLVLSQSACSVVVEDEHDDSSSSSALLSAKFHNSCNRTTMAVMSSR